MKFLGYDYREKPSPHRVPVFVIEDNDNLNMELLSKTELLSKPIAKGKKKKGSDKTKIPNKG